MHQSTTTTNQPAPLARVDGFDPVSFVMAYEAGELDDDDVVDGFQALVNSGLVWQLQGSYGRTAAAMIEAGMIDDPRARR